VAGRRPERRLTVVSLRPARDARRRRPLPTPAAGHGRISIRRQRSFIARRCTEHGTRFGAQRRVVEDLAAAPFGDAFEVCA
jgi:hypothetical protein